MRTNLFNIFFLIALQFFVLPLQKLQFLIMFRFRFTQTIYLILFVYAMGLFAVALKFTSKFFNDTFFIALTERQRQARKISLQKCKMCACELEACCFGKFNIIEIIPCILYIQREEKNLSTANSAAARVSLSFWLSYTLQTFKLNVFRWPHSHWTISFHSRWLFFLSQCT